MPRAERPATRNASHEGAGSEAVNAVVARAAPAVLELLADGTPRSKATTAEALAGRHDRQASSTPWSASPSPGGSSTPAESTGWRRRPRGMPAEPHRSRAAHVAAIEPFANEGNRLGIGGLTVENRTDRVSVYGGLDLTRDKRGLAHARELQTLLDRVVRALEAEKDLPDEVAPAKRPTRVENPFA